MKIYVVRFQLYLDDDFNYKTRFFITEKDGYELEGTYFIKREGYILDSVPTTYCIARSIYSDVVEIGVAIKPSQQEQQMLAMEMKKFLIQEIENQKKQIVDNFDTKIKTLMETENEQSKEV